MTVEEDTSRSNRADDAAESAPRGVDERDRRKDPENWTTGDEPMTGPQASYLETLAREAGVEVPEGLTKAEASKKIDELQRRTGRRGGRES